MNALEMNNYIDRLKIEDKIKFFINKYIDSVYLSNIDVVYNLSMFIGKFLNKKYYLSQEDFDNLPKYSDKEIIDMVKSYYEDMGMNCDIDSLYNNGVINFNGSSESLIYGECNKSNNKINLRYTGTIIDSILLTHELGHYKNEQSSLKSEEKLFVSEVLPMAEEFIMCDNLVEHSVEKIFWYKNRINSLYSKVKRINSILGMIIVYLDNGNISRESYIKEFESNNYDNDFNFLKKYLSKYKLENIFMDMIYLMGYVVGINVMYKVRNDGEIFNLVKDAQVNINNLDVYEFLTLFGIDIDDMNYVYLSKNVLNFVNEINRFEVNKKLR